MGNLKLDEIVFCTTQDIVYFSLHTMRPWDLSFLLLSFWFSHRLSNDSTCTFYDEWRSLLCLPQQDMRTCPGSTSSFLSVNQRLGQESQTQFQVVATLFNTSELANQNCLRSTSRCAGAGFTPFWTIMQNWHYYSTVFKCCFEAYSWMTTCIKKK